MEMLDPTYSTDGWGMGVSAWGGAEGIVVEDTEESWMMPNPEIDSMGAAEEDGDDVTDAAVPLGSSAGNDTAASIRDPAGERFPGLTTGPEVAGAVAADKTAAADAVAADATCAGPGTELCEVCGLGSDEANMLLCDSCPEGYHIYCLNPKLPAIPDDDWYCDKCEALGARTRVLDKEDAISCARRWYDTQSVFGTDHHLKMDPHAAFRNSALEWSLEYSTVPPTAGQPFLIRVRYKPERQGEIWTWNAVLFTEEGASRHPDKADQAQQYVIEKILDMQRRKGELEFKVKWVGYDKCTWEKAQAFHDASVWKSMVAKVEAVMERLKATEPESLRALRNTAWSVDSAVAQIIRERDEALARRLQREAGGLRQGSRRQALDEDKGPLIAESRSTTTAAVQEPWPPRVWKKGYRCDVKDEFGQWYEGTVVSVTLPRVKIRFKGFSDKYNEWKTVKPAPDDDQMRRLGEKTQASSVPTITTTAAAPASAKRQRPATTSGAASTSPVLDAKRVKTSPVRSSTASSADLHSANSVSALPTDAGKKKAAIKKEQPTLPAEHYLNEIKGQTREQRSKHWNKQRLVPLQTACKLRGLWPGGSRVHMRDRLLAFEFERNSLTDYDLRGPEAAPISSLASVPGVVVDIQGKIEYVIERVVDMKRGSDGAWKFKVKWYSFSDSENSWEPKESFNSKSMWSVFVKKLLEVIDKTKADEDTALLALRRSQWNKDAAIERVQKQQEENRSACSPAASDGDSSVQTAKRKARIVIPEGSDSDEPDDIDSCTSNIENVQASCVILSGAGGAAVQDDQSSSRLSFRGEAISCTVCKTESAEQLRRGLCSDGKVFCQRCSPAHTSCSATGVSARAEAPERQSKIPRKQSAASPDVFERGGNFGMQAKRSAPSARVVQSRDNQPDRAMRDSSRERSHRRARDIDSRSPQTHIASGDAATGRATGVCVRAPRTLGREFGFIRPAVGTSGKDLFFHVTAAFSGITEGQEVTFKIGSNRSGPIAVDVMPATTASNVDTQLAPPPLPSAQVAIPASSHRRAPAASHTTASLREQLSAMREASRSDSERFFLRHFNAVARVWGKRPIETAGIRMANNETVERVWQCLLDGDCEGFDSDILNHVAAWHLAKGSGGFSESTFNTLLRAKRCEQRQAERRVGRPAAGEVWTALEGAACEVEVVDKAYSMQRIIVPTRGSSCGHPRCFDMKTHVQEMIKKDRRKLWNDACAKLICDFKQELFDKRTDPRKLKQAVGMLECALKQLPTPAGEEMPPGVEMIQPASSQFLNALVRFTSEPKWQQMFTTTFADFWHGKSGERWRYRYTHGPHKYTMGQWTCPFCPGQRSGAAGWSKLIVDEALESVIQQAGQKCQDAQAVDVRCCAQAEADDGPRCGWVPLCVAGRKSDLALGWNAEQEESEDEEEVDLT